MPDRQYSALSASLRCSSRVPEAQGAPLNNPFPLPAKSARPVKPGLIPNMVNPGSKVGQ